VAVIRDPSGGPGVGQFAGVRSVGEPLGLDLHPINGLDAAETKRGIAAFARCSNGGVIVTVGGTGYRRDLTIPPMRANGYPPFTRSATISPTAN